MGLSIIEDFPVRELKRVHLEAREAGNYVALTSINIPRMFYILDIEGDKVRVVYLSRCVDGRGTTYSPKSIVIPVDESHLRHSYALSVIPQIPIERYDLIKERLGKYLNTQYQTVTS